MSAPRPMHVERTDDPRVLRWVLHHSSLRDAPSGFRRVNGDSQFSRLVADGSIVEVAVSSGEVLVRAADGDRWPDLAPMVRTALEQALDELDHPGPGRHWLLEPAPSTTTSEVPSVVEVQRIVDQAAGATIDIHGGSMTVVAVEPPVVRLRAGGACHGCAQSPETLLDRIMPAITSTHPTLLEVSLEPGEPTARKLITLIKRQRKPDQGPTEP